VRCFPPPAPVGLLGLVGWGGAAARAARAHAPCQRHDLMRGPLQPLWLRLPRQQRQSPLAERVRVGCAARRATRPVLRRVLCAVWRGAVPSAARRVASAAADHACARPLVVMVQCMSQQQDVWLVHAWEVVAWRRWHAACKSPGLLEGTALATTMPPPPPYPYKLHTPPGTPLTSPPPVCTKLAGSLQFQTLVHTLITHRRRRP
jgi:hypothetical protein